MSYELINYMDRPTYRVLQPRHFPAGIFSYMWVCMQSIYNYPNDKYYIDMVNFSTYYDPSITRTNNVWEYYWEQPHIKIYPSPRDIIDTGIWNAGDSGFSEAYSIVSTEKKQTYHDLITKHIRLLPHIQEKISKFMEKHNWKSKKILGVHCRGTDVYDKRPPDFYIKDVMEIENAYDNIFIITDEYSYIEVFKNLFGEKVIWYEDAVRSESAATLWTCPKLPYETGEGAVIDSYLLSYTQYVICPVSNVSTFSLYLNHNLKYTNIYLKYNVKLA